jgi:micrococcal nuclease
MSRRPERLLGVAVVLALAVALALVVAVLAERPGSGSTSTGASSAPTGATSATVIGVTDGDTIVVDVDGGRERVRYIGVDAPELARREDGLAAECGAEIARQANDALVRGADVLLARDVTDRDRFGRLLRHVWVPEGDGWILVSARLVEDGVMEARSFPPDTARDAELDSAERAARADGLGIWGSC